MIAIIDYGLGNLFSLSSSLRYIGAECVVTREKSVIEAADKIILPGVGAFGDAISKLNATGLIPTLNNLVGQKIILGICLGMQLLFDKSYEYGEHKGLGYIKGEICPLKPDLEAGGYNLKVPEIGWNGLHIVKQNNPLLKYTKEGDCVYYVHSFYAKYCDDAIVADSEYGVRVAGLVNSGMVYGTQFHPEKSGEVGLNILRAFAELRV